MYGDIMHGGILTIFGAYLCLSKREKGTLAHSFASVRYIFLMMGICATFCGLIYNGMSSLPVMLSESCWDMPDKAAIKKEWAKLPPNGKGEKKINVLAI